jgi:hypothetical protein
MDTPIIIPGLFTAEAMPCFAVPNVPTKKAALTRFSITSNKSVCYARLRKQRAMQPLCQKQHLTARERSSFPDSSRRLMQEENIFALCSELSSRCGGEIAKYDLLEPDLVSKIVASVGDLESMVVAGFGASKTRSKTIVGRWQLVFTNSSAIARNNGSIIGFPFPGSRCESIDVFLDCNGNARTIERIVTLNGLLRWTNSLVGKWSLTGQTGWRLEVTYAEAILFGRMKLRSDSKAVLETSYVGSLLRLGRSSSGTIFVFKRIGDET